MRGTAAGAGQGGAGGAVSALRRRDISSVVAKMSLKFRDTCNASQLSPSPLEKSMLLIQKGK